MEAVFVDVLQISQKRLPERDSSPYAEMVGFYMYSGHSYSLLELPDSYGGIAPT